MFVFIVRRLLTGLVLVVAISVIAFALLYAGGGNIARGLLGQEATAAAVAAKAHDLGLDRPLVTQFSDWVGHAITGDLGQSWFTGQPVGAALLSRLAVTLSLIVGATLITAIVALLLGALAATRRGAVDRVIQVVSMLGYAIPGFLVALVLVLFFAIQLHLFKPTGYIVPTTSIAGWLGSITLPVVALSFAGIASVTQQIRGSMLDALRQDYVRTLRSRGLPAGRVVLKHVLRNAAGPALAVLGVHIVGLLGGAVIIEQMFALPGVGQIAVTATSQGDIPLVMGLVIVTAALVVVFNLVVDLIHGWLNPKVRLT